MIISNQTLVLQSVKLDNAGLYTCVASNVVADGESNALHLDIKCKFPRVDVLSFFQILSLVLIWNRNKPIGLKVVKEDQRLMGLMVNRHDGR